MCIDFIQQVHKCRTNRRYSKAIQSCIDYIETHLREPLTIELLAGRLGYSKYYLSNRFKAETNCSINNYIKFCRIEQAKQILACSQKRIDEIASNWALGPGPFRPGLQVQCGADTRRLPPPASQSVSAKAANLGLTTWEM